MVSEMKEVVVFCSDVINSLGLVRALGESGYEVECFCYGKSTNYILGSKYVSKGYGFKTCEEAVKYLVQICPDRKEKRLLFTLPDPPQYWVDTYLETISEKFVVFNAGEPGRVKHWMDKKNISDLARKHGFSVPWMIKRSKHEPVPEGLKFPVFIKSSNSTEGGKIDEGICYSEEELRRRVDKLVASQYVVMDYIKKVKEINYFGIAINDHVYIDYHDERDRFRIDGYGYYNVFHLCKYDDVLRRMVDFIKETRYQGLFDVEFLLGEDGIMYFTEVNFRVDGEVYKLMPGINLADYWCKLVALPPDQLPEKLETQKKDFAGMTEIDDFRIGVLSGKVNFFVWLWQFFESDRRMLVNMKDPLPFFIKVRDVIKRKIVRGNNL